MINIKTEQNAVNHKQSIKNIENTKLYKPSCVQSIEILSLSKNNIFLYNKHYFEVLSYLVVLLNC